MPPTRKRRAAPNDSDDDASSRSSSETPATQPRQQQRRRVSSSPDADGDGDAEGQYNEENDMSQIDGTQSYGSHHTMVKKLVRLALASEYSRQVIRRTEISQKVLGAQGARQFKPVFAEAQKVLKETFGMQMIEQPMKEKLTISQRRAAQRAEKSATTSKSWTVVSTLPAEYRTPEILQPPRAPSSAEESTYIALYTFIISLIMMSGGSISEQKLNRHLNRVKAQEYTPIDRTDRLLARLCKEGYLLRHRDVDSGEEVIEYHVGPRGKIEVGVNGVSGLAREVYGFGRSGGAEGEGEGEGEDEDEENGEGRRRRNRNQNADEDGDPREAFEQKLRRSLGIRDTNRGGDAASQEQADAAGEGEVNGEASRRRRSQRGNNGEDSDY